MKGRDQQERDDATDIHPPFGRNATVGLQGEALIVELRSAKRAIDQGRGGDSRREDGPPRRPLSASPEPLLRGRAQPRGMQDGGRERMLAEQAPPGRKQSARADRVSPEPLLRGAQSRGMQDGSRERMPAGPVPAGRKQSAGAVRVSPEPVLRGRAQPRAKQDGSRERVLPEQAPPGRKQGARADRVPRQLPRPAKRLDRFDDRLLQNPTAVAQASPKLLSGPKVGKRSPVPAIDGWWQTLRTTFTWLVSGAQAHDDTLRDFTAQILRRHDVELKAASRVLVISAVLAGGWATLVPLSGAIVLPGTLVVESSVKKIQHPTGGIVAEIPVQDGMHVDPGTLLVRLDETQVQAQQQMVANELDQARMRIARLIAERDGKSEIELPKQLADRLNDPSIAHLVASETSVFNARASARQGQKDLYQQQIDGFNGEIKSKSSQLDLIANELVGVKELYAKGLVPLTRLNGLQRDSAQLDGDRAQLTASIAEAKAKIMQIDQDFRSEVTKDLREAQDKEAELVEKNVSAKDELNRVDIRAPTSGIVHELAVHTIGGVIKAGDVIMEIVPDSDDLEIEGHLAANEIDQVTRGQPAYLRFSTLDRQTMPQVRGQVSYVSADVSHEQSSGAQNGPGYYTVKIALPSGERHHLDGLTLVSGMPVEIYLQTGSRTMLSYLFKPITNQFHRMFNEP
ncbi:MAG TPA: HlyD family type I secretion periplasmic adaptor subunit [Xanthobacteraceae bacterium]|jgi:HlyD family secretion protein